jgi:hypothetical protein
MWSHLPAGYDNFGHVPPHVTVFPFEGRRSAQSQAGAGKSGHRPRHLDGEEVGYTSMSKAAAS